MRAKPVLAAILMAVNKHIAILWAPLLFLVFGELAGQTPVTPVAIKYISADKVYIGGGKANGISVGDKLQIVENGKMVAKLKVVFVADHSASCEIISGKGAIKVGAVVIIKSAITSPEIKKTKKERRTRAKLRKRRKDKRSSTRVSGYLGLQWYQFLDTRNNRNDFKQPTVRFKLKIKNIWDDAYNFKIKARSRYNRRTRRINIDVPAKEWRNRIYEAAFSYDNTKALLNYKVGRIISNKFSGVGYIDGLLVQHNVTDRLRWGLFGGTQPEWQYSDFQTSIQKYGLYVNYLDGEYGKQRFESTLALAGAYHGSVVSREFLYLQNNYSYGRKWNLYQSLELDINRDWRKQRTGESLSITGIYANGHYNITDDMSVGLNYDNRKNYYTYELRSLADSLFDDAFRQGARLSFAWRFLKNYRFYTNFGGRLRATDSEPTYSYTGGLSVLNIFNQRVTFSARFSGFSNFYTAGFNPTLSFSKYFSRGHSLRLDYGNYFYTLKSGNTNRLNQFIRLDAQIELPLRFYISNNYEYTWGDDSQGHRIFSEMGYRF